MKPHNLYKPLLTGLTFIAVFLYLWLAVPQYLMYQEQYQMFLFTWRYFTDAVSVPGGFADYLSEFVVQFDYIPLYGALLTSAVLTMSQVFMGMAIRSSEGSVAVYAVSAMPAILFTGAMADENTLLSFGAAMMLTTLFVYLATLIGKRDMLIESLILLLMFAILYWLAGPLAFAFVIAVAIIRCRSVLLAVTIPFALIIVFAVHSVWFEQYPLARMLMGLNYYRIPEHYPAVYFVIAGVVALMPLPGYLPQMHRKSTAYIWSAAALVFGIIYVPMSYNSDKSSLLEYDALVRQGRWDDIIAKADSKNPATQFERQAMNLALAMKGQLTEKMFRYPQKGMESLIGAAKLDNTTQLITAEAQYRMGLTNIAFSTTFDLQEAIMNDRKSGRFMKRLAECMIINGNYKVAAKYMGLLSHTLFYKDWAEKSRNLLDNDDAVSAHPVYGPLRSMGFGSEAFYDYTQLDKILALQAVGNDNANHLAWQYCCAALMLKGDVNTLAGLWSAYGRRFAGNGIPRHVQEALALGWSSAKGSFEGIPFALNPEVKHQTVALADAAMKHPGNPEAWHRAAPDSYGLYFLANARKNNADVDEYSQSTHE